MATGSIRQRWFGPGSGEALKSILAALLIMSLATLVFLAYRNYAARQRNEGDVTGEGAEGGSVHREPAPAAHSSAPAAQADPSSAATDDSSAGSRAPNTGMAAKPNGAPAPSTDSIAPNPPNGLAFGGSGHFQVYRQGDITWRLDTGTGATCILFATDAEWRQPRIRRSACNQARR